MAFHKGFLTLLADEEWPLRESMELGLRTFDFVVFFKGDTMVKGKVIVAAIRTEEML